MYPYRGGDPGSSPGMTGASGRDRDEGGVCMESSQGDEHTVMMRGTGGVHNGCSAGRNQTTA
jgi:hypothetical protein